MQHDLFGSGHDLDLRSNYGGKIIDRTSEFKVMIEKQNLQNSKILTFHDLCRPNRWTEVKFENAFRKDL